MLLDIKIKLYFSLFEYAEQGVFLELNRDSILKIFNKNFSFPIVDTPVGEAVSMPPIQAFLFANITGAGYLDDDCFPFTPKGMLKILREAFNYNFVTGIFDRHNLYCSPGELIKTKPYLFEGNKYIILCEANSESDFRNKIQSVYQNLTRQGIKTTDFIIFRIESWKNGNGMECFLEYLTCEYFKKQGFIVENQVPLRHTIGTPDFAGYKIKDSQGFHIIELALQRITGNYVISKTPYIEKMIVGEAKTSTAVMASQLEKYLTTGLFVQGFEIHPDKKAPAKKSFGLIRLNNDFELECREPEIDYIPESASFNPKEYNTWFINYLKLYIISNFTNAELIEYINRLNPKGEYKQDKIIRTIKELSVEELMKAIKE